MQPIEHRYNFESLPAGDDNSNGSDSSDEDLLEPNEPSGSQTAQFIDALTFMINVKRRFELKPSVYADFVQLLVEYEYHQDLRPMSKVELCAMVKSLFRDDNDDLYQHFLMFANQSC